MRKKNICLSLLTVAALNCYAQSTSPISANYKISPIHMQSRWANQVSPINALKEYPRPQLQRKHWLNLNGLWEYSITDATAPAPSTFEGNILVPYPIESALSGVQKNLMPNKCLWYKKHIIQPSIKKDERTLINVGAIDWESTIFINSKMVGQHTGGYQSFSYDITDFLRPGSNEILIKVNDPSDQGTNPHGKQVLNPQNIYYTPSSGIWQTVWLETVPATHITHLKTTPNIDNGTLDVTVTTTGDTENISLEILTSVNGKTISSDKVEKIQTKENKKINIPNMRLWSPDDPFLYDLTLKLIRGNKVIDEVTSYFGMRKIDIQKDEKGTDRIFLNNKYTYNLGILDQGFWPEGLYTAPTDEALYFDIKTIKSMGFNTIRKHIKIEPERWYYHADKIGILIWQDFVNPPHGLPEGSKPIFEKEVQETIEQLYNHPSIITWVLFNERWGSYDQERLTKWIKKLDPSRIVDGHSGELLYVNNKLREPATSPWIGSDMTDVHSYPEPRNSPPQPNKARVVGEFGGIGVSVPGHEWDDMQGWGYIQVLPSELREKYIHMTDKLKELEAQGLSASIFTQPFDVEGEENGLLTYDREIIKIPINEIRNINRQMVNLTSGFSLDTNYLIASNIDTNDNDNRYKELLNEYEKGNRDSSFLRRLTLMSVRKKDQKSTTKIGNDFISGLTTPFSKENLMFMLKLTRTSQDKGFDLFLKHPEMVDAKLGENVAITKVNSIIEDEEIIPYKTTTPDWDFIEKRVYNKYGEIGKTLVLGRRMLFYGMEAQTKNWGNFSKYYMLYFERALTFPVYDNNNFSWLIYEHTNDPKILSFAATVMKYTIEKGDQSPEAYDTYAHLLHKLNKFNEAIQWEEQALRLGRGTPYEKIFAETLQKMKSGLPAWPQTQNN